MGSLLSRNTHASASLHSYRPPAQMTLTAAPSRWSIDLASLTDGLPALEIQPSPSIRRSQVTAASLTTPTTPLPHLPLELVACFLAFADSATLAVASRVCWSWLKEASPLLYEQVTIARHGAFEELFLLRVRFPPTSMVQQRRLTY